ncbi:MAG: serine hydrolase [Methylococcaceae bacterium]|nr:serine hydrolase [Methylococcaceae bacterium]
MKKHLIRLLLLLFLLQGWMAWSQEIPPTAPPETVGLSSVRLAKLSDFMRQHVEEKKIGGAVVLIARHGKIAYVENFGQADVGKPMEKNTLFRIASMTKPIVSVAVLQLYEEGRLLLSDPVSKYIPEFGNPQVMEALPTGAKPAYRLVPAKREITIHDLLRHTAGLPYRFVVDWYPDSPVYQQINRFYAEADIDLGLAPTDETAGDLVRRLARLPLAAQPGEAFVYGHAADVLGYLVELVAKMPLDEFLRKRIFEPLRMIDTHFFLPEEKVSRLSAIWETDWQGHLAKFSEGVKKEGNFVFAPEYPYRGGRRFFGGGAGLISSVYDYLRFCQMLLNHGELDGTRLLSRKTVELMTDTNHIGDLHADFLHGKGWKFGLGVAIENDRSQDVDSGSVGTFEWAGIFSTRFSVDPKEKKITLLFTQTLPFSYHVSLWDKVLNLSNAAIAD